MVTGNPSFHGGVDLLLVFYFFVKSEAKTLRLRVLAQIKFQIYISNSRFRGFYMWHIICQLLLFFVMFKRKNEKKYCSVNAVYNYCIDIIIFEWVYNSLHISRKRFWKPQIFLQQRIIAKVICKSFKSLEKRWKKFGNRLLVELIQINVQFFCKTAKTSFR